MTTTSIRSFQKKTENNILRCPKTHATGPNVAIEQILNQSVEIMVPTKKFVQGA